MVGVEKPVPLLGKMSVADRPLGGSPPVASIRHRGSVSYACACVRCVANASPFKGRGRPGCQLRDRVRDPPPCHMNPAGLFVNRQTGIQPHPVNDNQPGFCRTTTKPTYPRDLLGPYCSHKANSLGFHQIAVQRLDIVVNRGPTDLHLNRDAVNRPALLKNVLFPEPRQYL